MGTFLKKLSISKDEMPASMGVLFFEMLYELLLLCKCTSEYNTKFIGDFFSSNSVELLIADHYPIIKQLFRSLRSALHFE
jgi:hypothetical protein